MVRPAKRLGLTMIPVDVVKGPSMKAVLVFDWSSFRLNHAAVNVESHLVSLGSVSECCGSLAGHGCIKEHQNERKPIVSALLETRRGNVDAPRATQEILQCTCQTF